MKLKFYQFIVFVALLISNPLHAKVQKTKFDASLLTSYSYTSKDNVLDLKQAYGVSFTFRNLYRKAQTKFSLRSDFFNEAMQSQEGSFSIGVDRYIFREWAMLTNSVTSDFLIGTGIAFGFSQSVVETRVQDESFRSYGTLEPLWGLMLDGQYSLNSKLIPNLFIDIMIRKMFANNYNRGERNELDFGLGIKF